MLFSRVFRLSAFILSLTVITVLSGCASLPQPEVQDFDSYQVIDIGPATYMTPAGIRAVHQEKGLVQHEAQSLPGTVIVVQLEADPPRSLAFDADELKRTFLRQLPNGYLSSVQYDELDETQFVKIFVRGWTEERVGLFGALTLVRRDGETVLVKLVGPVQDRVAISRLSENLGQSITINP